MLKRLRHPVVPRAAIVVALLSLAVVVTGALSWEAISSARLARATAEGVLRDYATFAARQFTRESEVRLDTRVSAALNAVRHEVEGHARAGGLHSAHQEDCGCTLSSAVRTIFAFSRSGVSLVSDQPLDEALASEVRAPENWPDAGSPPQVRVLEQGGIVVTAPGRRDGEPIVMGFVAGEVLLNEVFTRVMQDTSLLPRTLVDEAAARQMLAIRVTDATGRERFASSREQSAFSGRAQLAARLGGMQIEAVIPPQHSSQLLIGGLPSERWPLAVGLLALAAALVVAAAVQLRSEIRFVRQRADFVSGVSHELRTPLAQIRLFGETLLLGRVRSRGEERRAAEIIVQEARRLGQMVDNLLTFSRTGRGPSTPCREPIDLGSLTMDVVEGFQQQAVSKDAKIVLTASGEMSSLLVDPNALRQILLNLLDNAVKYGPRGQTVHVGVATQASRLRITVDDEGPGIALDERAQIWEPFWRASGSVEGGTGLGLAIVRELATIHGGTAKAETAASGGARFVIDLDAPPARLHGVATRDAMRQPA